MPARGPERSAAIAARGSTGVSIVLPRSAPSRAAREYRAWKNRSSRKNRSAGRARSK
jgi:hypothetical protein